MLGRSDDGTDVLGLIGLLAREYIAHRRVGTRWRLR
jgi:hypothetical protein